MISSNKHTAHKGCSCNQCRHAPPDVKAIIAKANEKKLRGMGKRELTKAVKELDLDALEEADVTGVISSPYKS